MRIWSHLLRVKGKLKTCLSDDCPNAWSEVEAAWAPRFCFKCLQGNAMWGINLQFGVGRLCFVFKGLSEVIGGAGLDRSKVVGLRLGFVAFPGPEEGTWGTRLSAHRASAGQLCPGFFPRDLCEICRRFLQRHALIPAHEPLAFQAKPEAYRLYELLALLRSQIVPDVSGKSRPNAIQIQLGSLRGADGDGCALPCDLFKKCLQPRTTPSPFNCKEPSSFIGDI